MEPKEQLILALSALFPGADNGLRIRETMQGYIVMLSNEQRESDVNARINQFLAARRIDGLAQKTLQTYRYVLKGFSEHMTRPVREIGVDDLRMYIAYLYDERQISRQSVKLHINTMRSFFGWMTLEEIIDRNPMLKINTAKDHQRNRRQALTPEEQELLRDACHDYREKALVEFFISTGCRLDEVVRLRFSDLNFRERCVTVRGKGNKERTVFFSVRAKLMLESYYSERKGGTGLFSLRIWRWTVITTRAEAMASRHTVPSWVGFHECWRRISKPR